MYIAQVQNCQVDILQPVLSSRSDPTFRQLPSLRGCQISMTAKGRRVTIHIVLAAATSVAVKRLLNDRGRHPARLTCRRHVKRQVQVPLTICSIAVATSSIVDRITGRGQLRRHCSGRTLTATRYHAICSISPSDGEASGSRTD